MKKVLSLVLALAMVLTLAAPAFASSGTTISGADKLATGASVKVAGETNVGVVKVTIPSAGTMVLNPYGLKYSATVNGVDLTDKQDQVIYPTQYIASNSTAALDVTASVTGVVAGNAKLVAAAFDPVGEHADGVKAPNNLFLVMQTADVAAADTPTEPTWTALTTTEDLTDAAYVGDTNGYVHKLVVSTRGVATKVGKLAASADTTGTANTYVAFRFTGLAEKNPDTPWTAADKVTATIAFTFAPTKATT